MDKFKREIRRIVENHPEVATRIKKAFPEAFSVQRKFILHIGDGLMQDPTKVSCLYFLGEEKDFTDSIYVVKLDGTWSNLTSHKYPDDYNKLFTGILKVEDGVLVEVNET